jgi:hypothetical protein
MPFRAAGRDRYATSDIFCSQTRAVARGIARSRSGQYPQLEHFVRNAVVPFWHHTCTAKMGRATCPSSTARFKSTEFKVATCRLIRSAPGAETRRARRIAASGKAPVVTPSLASR